LRLREELQRVGGFASTEELVEAMQKHFPEITAERVRRDLKALETQARIR
jgi:hypothetical protein